MSRIVYRDEKNKIRVTLMHEGKPVALNPTDDVMFMIMTSQGKPLMQNFEKLLPDTEGSDWSAGKVVAHIDTTQNLEIWEKYDKGMMLVRGPFGQYVEELKFMRPLQLERSQLFVKDMVVPDMRRDQLLAAASGVMRDVKLSDDFIWQKLKAAESEIAHTLRILLTPHQIFPEQPTAAEIAALDGMPYLVEVPYDYQPTMFERDKWGYFITRQRPIIAVQRMRFNMPAVGHSYFDVPPDWIRLDEKYGHVRILPNTNASIVTTSILGFTALTWQSTIPNMINVTYTAGIKDAWADYPELIDAIKKTAVVKILTDLFLPQSGSISADGLSESMSTDIAKYTEQVDHIINGSNGNGGLMALFNGIRAIIC